MRAIDTNVLIRLAIRDDPRQTEVAEAFTPTAPGKHPKLGFSDCLILEVARKAGHLPLGTFDRSLGRLEGTHRL